MIFKTAQCRYRDSRKSPPHMLEIKKGHAKNVTGDVLEDVSEELKLIAKDSKNKYILLTLTPYFLWELSLYTLVVYLTDYSHQNASKIITLTMMGGYLIGIAILFLCQKVKNVTIIKWGYYISFLSLIPYFFLFKVINTNTLLLLCYFVHTLGNALLCPTLLRLHFLMNS